MRRAPNPKAAWVLAGLPLFFVGHGLAQYAAFVPVQKAALLLLQYLLAAGILWLLFSAWRKDPSRAVLDTTVTLAFYFFFGGVKDGLAGLFPGIFLVKYSVLLPIWLAAWAAAVMWLGNRGRTRRILGFLAPLWFILLLIDGIAFIRNRGRAEIGPALAACAGCPRPDVYLIILDGYAGLPQLQQELGFDNRPFLDSLRGLGFEVAAASRSNYQDTPFSMASLFQMNYLSLPRFTYTDANLTFCYTQIYDNPVVRRFRREGYEIRNLSIFDIRNSPAPYDNTLLVSGARLISSQTLGQRLYRDLYSNIIYAYFKGTAAYDGLVNQARDINEAAAKATLAEAARRPQEPRFVYTHFAMPHAPYYYGANGRPNPSSATGPENLGRMDLYLGYLQYTNRFALDYLRQMRAAARPGSIFLLLSDHGSREVPRSKLRYSNLAALSFPGAPRVYYDSVSNVNQFRLLFRTLFRDTLAVLPDRTY
ncbi:hypothetical protein [Flaviaesturariibacter amylovorans]|uniref:Sulfatase N-terminal domain-containing protein n=1 Tax=Flaviaesturariibacter amylovorans TaxID=1084520 RepID=A0ABP8GL80_9BACT